MVKKYLRKFLLEADSPQQRYFITNLSGKEEFGFASMKEEDWIKFVDNIHDMGSNIKAITRDEYLKKQVNED